MLQKNQDKSLKNVRNAFVQNRSVRVKNKLPKDQMQKHTHTVDTAKELTTQQTCSRMVQTRLTDLKGTKLKTMIIQYTRVINQERLRKMPRSLSSKIPQTEKSTTPLATFNNCNPICIIRRIKYFLPHI